MKKNRTKYIIWGTIGLVVLLLILKKTGAFGSKGGIEVEVAKAAPATIIETVNASGKLQPEHDIKISADISGEIIDLPVKEGDKIKKGDLLARIKPDPYQRAVEKAHAGVNGAQAAIANSKATLAQAQAHYEKSKIAFQRGKTLMESNTISKSDFEVLETDFKVAQAQLDGAREGVSSAEFNLQSALASLKDANDALMRTSLFSPSDGYISKLNVTLGERVVGTMQMAGTELMRVADLSKMEVVVDVNENDIVRLHLNDTADISVDAFRNDVFKGLVTEISSSAESSQLSVEKVTNFQVKIKVLESSYRHLVTPGGLPTPFRPGMSASVSIQTKRAENVLSVPILAVTVRNEEGVRDSVASTKDEEVVFIYDNGKVKQRTVKTGIQDDVHIEVTEGLKAGETVVSGPYSIVSKLLKDDMKVSIVKKQNG